MKNGWLILAIFAVTACHNGTKPIFKNDSFAIFPDSIVQGDFEARALSPTKIISTYKSPQSVSWGTEPKDVSFRFSLNSRDNELPLGVSHEVTITKGDTLWATFGTPAITKQTHAKQQSPSLTLHLDMKPVLRSFDKKGYFVTAAADTVYADDFKGVWVAGSFAPLTWDFENLYGKPDRRLIHHRDSVFSLTINLNEGWGETKADKGAWEISRARFDSLATVMPMFSSGQTIVDACYTMALDEIESLKTFNQSNAPNDTTFRTGASWEGVWTRDVSYSALLSLALLDPVTTQASLLAKVKDGRIIQDTGTGGAWPVSSDREVWGIAAWEIYLVTGDKEWLQQAYSIIKSSLDDDLKTVYDNRFGLMHGEQSYLDWREQSYPRWMQPADIYSSMCLGTNAVFAQTFTVLSLMEQELGLKKAYDKNWAHELRCHINDYLWMPDKGYYGQYLYGDFYPFLSPNCDNLGQSLCVLFNVATPEMASSLVSQTPVTPYGTPSIFPQLPDIQPYHNDAVWPFVQAFWNLAAAKVSNEKALLAGMAQLWRAAAMFTTNKELYVASTGDFAGTAVNSDAQLWSAAGNAAMVLKILTGIELTPQGMALKPVIPTSLQGTKKLSGLHYRNATFDITIEGTGTLIKSYKLDGKYMNTNNVLSPALEGHHNVVITMANNAFPASSSNLTQQTWMPPTPIISPKDHKIVVTNYNKNCSYNVFINGTLYQDTTSQEFTFPTSTSLQAMAIVPEDKEGWCGFSMRPVLQGRQYFISADSIQALHGSSLIENKEISQHFVELTSRRNISVSFKFTAPQAGKYFIDFRYANGSGPVNTENKCAIRTLFVNNREAGPVIMPQRGVDEWLSTGYSNPLLVSLNQGTNDFNLKYVIPQNVNMNGKTNTALIKFIRLIPCKN